MGAGWTDVLEPIWDGETDTRRLVVCPEARPRKEAYLRLQEIYELDPRVDARALKLSTPQIDEWLLTFAPASDTDEQGCSKKAMHTMKKVQTTKPGGSVWWKDVGAEVYDRDAVPQRGTKRRERTAEEGPAGPALPETCLLPAFGSRQARRGAVVSGVATID